MMKGIQKFGLLTALACILAGCASVQKASLSADSAAKTFSPLPDKGTLYVYRKPVLLWAKGQTTPITVDGVMVATLRPGQFMMARVVPGAHTITSATMDTLRVQVEPGKNYFIRENQTVTGAWLNQIEATPGEADVKKCDLVLNLVDEANLKPIGK